MISIFRRNQSTVGLDIGSGYIKVAVIDHSGSEPELTHIAHTPLIPDAIVEGEIMDPQLVADTIRSVFETTGIDSKLKVVTAVGGRDVIVKRIQMDRMKEADAREVIRWEAEQYVPFDMANVQLDFQILDPDEEGLQMSVLLVAAKRDVVDQKLSLLRDAGLSAAIVDVDAFALHNAFQYNYPRAKDGVVALVNVGHEISTVNVLQDGSPVLTRDIPFGSRRLRERLRRMHGVTAEQADDILHSPTSQEEQYGDVLTEGSEELAIGVERAVSFLAMEGAGSHGLAGVYLCGGGARTPGIADAVADRLRARTEIANPLQQLRVRPGATAHVPMEEIAPMLMLPIGLALRSAA